MVLFTAVYLCIRLNNSVLFNLNEISFLSPPLFFFVPPCPPMKGCPSLQKGGDRKNQGGDEKFFGALRAPLCPPPEKSCIRPC